MSVHADRLAILVHEVRSPVAALEALVVAAQGTTDPALVTRLARLGVAAGRDVERLATDAGWSLGDVTSVPVCELLGTCGALGATTNVVPGEWAVKGDATRLRQALANVVANGLRHGTAVEVTAWRDALSILIDITDDGPGLEPGLDVFARGVSGAGSSGYGLWLAREIARLHGGSLDVVPDSAAAARFRFVLPSASAS